MRLDTSNRLVDFAREDIDIAIRSGGGNWPGVEVHKLFNADFTPMLSPKLAATIGGVKEPADLLRLPILDPGDIWWRDWFIAASLPVEELAKRPGSSMGAQAYEANAAIAGQGVAIVTAALFKAELADGRLSIWSATTATPIGWSIPRRGATCRRSALFANGSWLRLPANSR